METPVTPPQWQRCDEILAVDAEAPIRAGEFLRGTVEYQKRACEELVTAARNFPTPNSNHTATVPKTKLSGNISPSFRRTRRLPPCFVLALRRTSGDCAPHASQGTSLLGSSHLTTDAVAPANIRESRNARYLLKSESGRRRTI